MGKRQAAYKPHARVVQAPHLRRTGVVRGWICGEACYSRREHGMSETYLSRRQSSLSSTGTDFRVGEGTEPHPALDPA